jgi:hypothetical protein
MFHKDLKGQDLHGSRVETGTASPVGVVTPSISGVLYADILNGVLWISTGLTNTDWQVLAVSSASPFLTLDFAYNDISPIDFGLLLGGETIIDVDVVIATPFDDPSAMLSVGLASSPGNILPTSAIDPTTAGTYNCGEDFNITGSDAVRLQIVPGSSTQGSGKVIVTVRRT